MKEMLSTTAISGQYYGVHTYEKQTKVAFETSPYNDNYRHHWIIMYAVPSVPFL